uniref:RAD51D splice variant c n=1 Tax=Arabidopsis thaliana TaxID=3702 RepID=A3QS66_ARATH|nr:RAD51D splice variant c [Arabidopsis thaliana]ABE02573.1 RAD51D splice variant d [Arabidopsis thaliana]ABE02574.1 RAD51D splice variant e [Arabidopsis thaliana]ABE02660.1 RAD51D splice variant c [Arabidopsis thaliana]ABE02661.1 RAD51D splice variant d [Arabidopsis thaliana]
MAPLKHLEKENPIIDACFQDFCASHGILTSCVLHLLFLYLVFSYRFYLISPVCLQKNDCGWHMNMRNTIA